MNPTRPNGYKELRALGLDPAGFAVMHRCSEADYRIFCNEDEAVYEQAAIIDSLEEGEPDPPLEGLYLGSQVAAVTNELLDNKQATAERLESELEGQRILTQESNVKVHRLWHALANLVGVTSKPELEAMVATVRGLFGIEKDKVDAINAIHVLLDTMPLDVEVVK